MKFKILVISFLVFNSAAWADPVKPKYGPEGKPYATPLSQSRDYFQSPKHPAPDFWALIGYYVPQFNDAACSVASVSMVLNAARTAMKKTADDKLVLQTDLLDKVDIQNWKDRIGESGYGSRKIHGVNLDALREVTEAAFRANGFTHAKAEAVHVKDVTRATLSRVEKILIQNEKSTRDFVLANFTQKAFTDDSDAGHIAPVGAYDAARKRVLILDPDRQWYEPYWVTLKRFVEGMNTKDSESGEFRGFVVVHVN